MKVRLLEVEAEHIIVIEKLVIEGRILAEFAYKLVGDAHKLLGGDRKLVEADVQIELDLDHFSYADAR